MLRCRQWIQRVVGWYCAMHGQRQRRFTASSGLLRRRDVNGSRRAARMRSGLAAADDSRSLWQRDVIIRGVLRVEDCDVREGWWWYSSSQHVADRQRTTRWLHQVCIKLLRTTGPFATGYRVTRGEEIISAPSRTFSTPFPPCFQSLSLSPPRHYHPCRCLLTIITTYDNHKSHNRQSSSFHR